MDTSVVAYLFSWKGDLYFQVERVHRSSGRRYAPRDRLATWHTRAPLRLSEDQAVEWMTACVNQWLAAGLPKHAWHEGAALSAPPSGGHGGVRVAPPIPGVSGLPSTTRPEPLEVSGAAGVSDGLQPPGTQPPLF